MVKISRVVSAFVLRDGLNKEERLLDFIGMCILLGNDYLPKIPGVGFTSLLEANKYRKGKCVLKDDKFNSQSLLYLMQQLTPVTTNNDTLRDPRLYLKGLDWCASLYLLGISVNDEYKYDLAPPWIHELRRALQ